MANFSGNAETRGPAGRVVSKSPACGGAVNLNPAATVTWIGLGIAFRIIETGEIRAFEDGTLQILD